MYGKRYGISVIPIVGKIPTMGILFLTIIIFSRAISSENATNAIQYAMGNTLKSSMFCKMAFMALLFSLYFLFFSFLASFTFASHKLTRDAAEKMAAFLANSHKVRNFVGIEV